MGEHAKDDDIELMSEGDEDMSHIDGGVEGEFGETLFKGKEDPKEGDDPDLQDDDDSKKDVDPDQDDEAARLAGGDQKDQKSDETDKGPIPYARFKEVNDERKDFYEKSIKMEQQIETLTSALQSEEFTAFRESFSAKKGVGEKTSNDVDLEKFVYEGKDDSVISNTLVNAAVARSTAAVLPAIQQLSETVNKLIGSQQTVSNDAFFKGNELANENKAEILSLMKTRGLTANEAYLIKCGEQIQKQAFDKGHKHKNQKLKNDVLGPTGKVPDKTGKVKKFATVEAALEDTMREKGVSWS